MTNQPFDPMKKIIILALCSLCGPYLLLAQSVTYADLYQKAYNLGSTQPDSAIYYGQQALKLTTKEDEKAQTHWLIAFYAREIGNFRFAISHYKKAYSLYTGKSEKATMLKDIAYCYKNVGDGAVLVPQKTTDTSTFRFKGVVLIAIEAAKIFQQLRDTTKLIHSLNLLGNCYKTEQKFEKSDSVFQLAIQLAKKKQEPTLKNVYGDYARLKERVRQYDSAVYYQRVALEQFPNKNLSKKTMRYVRLAKYYLLQHQLDSTKYYRDQALAIPQKSPNVTVYLKALQGLVAFIDKEIAQGQAYYAQCDSIILQLKNHSSSPVQQRYARKISYEVYYKAHEMLQQLQTYGGAPHRFAPTLAWFKKRLQYEKDLYDNAKVSAALRDSLVIERTRPKIQVTHRVNPWWWWLTLGVLTICGGLLYWRRERKLQAEKLLTQASQDFVQQIKSSPIRDYGEPKPTEIKIVGDIEERMGKKLTTDEVKILLMIRRGDAYNKIHLATNIPVGTIKSTVNRIKTLCKVDNIRDLM